MYKIKEISQLEFELVKFNGNINNRNKKITTLIDGELSTFITDEKGRRLESHPDIPELNEKYQYVNDTDRKMIIINGQVRKIYDESQKYIGELFDNNRTLSIFDDNGRITSITVFNNDTVSNEYIYSYDTLGRLIRYSIKYHDKVCEEFDIKYEGDTFNISILNGVEYKQCNISLPQRANLKRYIKILTDDDKEITTFVLNENMKNRLFINDKLYRLDSKYENSNCDSDERCLESKLIIENDKLIEARIINSIRVTIPLCVKYEYENINK